jgi:hypothetical protein
MKVWVCETILRGHDKWYVWKAEESRQTAFGVMRLARKAYPKERFRVRKYIPEASK